MYLGIDTSIGTSIAVVTNSGETLFEALSADTRAHAEVIGSFIQKALAAADANTKASGEALEGVVIGMGPGPFTGLRIGIAAGRAIALGRDIPHYGVCSHDAVPEFGKVGTDVRRREHAVSHYDAAGTRVFGPALIPNVELGEDIHRLTEIPAAKLAALGKELALEPSLSFETQNSVLDSRAPNGRRNIQVPFYLRDADAVPATPKAGAK